MKLGLFGRPVSHSKSPRIFARLGRLLKKEIEYRAVAVPGPLAPAVVRARADGWKGANVTIPLKEEAIALADERTIDAEHAGAANVLKFGRTTTAHNSDSDGFADALARAGVALRGKRVVVFGAGGAARAVAYACAKRRAASIRLVSRRRAPAARIAADLSRRFGSAFSTSGVPAAADVWVNATPLGMKGFPDESPAPKDFPSPRYALDLVYGRRTAFQRDARRRGARVQDGAAMLVFQALRAYEFWAGPLGAARRARLAEKLIQEIS